MIFVISINLVNAWGFWGSSDETDATTESEQDTSTQSIEDILGLSDDIEHSEDSLDSTQSIEDILGLSDDIENSLHDVEGEVEGSPVPVTTEDCPEEAVCADDCEPVWEQLRPGLVTVDWGQLWPDLAEECISKVKIEVAGTLLLNRIAEQCPMI